MKGKVMHKDINTPIVNNLYKTISEINSVEDCQAFFEDICTINEILSLSQRLEVARLLRENKTYIEIAEATKASTATISRVNRSLNYGNGSFDKIFKNKK